jgi:CRISPR/Cas system-associated exonuclease Cas4 (RecB family)
MNPNEPEAVSDAATGEELLNALSNDSFETWHDQRERRKNIENGKAHYNQPGNVPPAMQHRPSSLAVCSRKIAYRQTNAPSESDSPTGIFWMGTKFEEKIILPYLREIASAHGRYGTNDMWVEFEIETDSEPLTIRGSTDPVITDRQGRPVLPTEVKSTSSVDHLDEPRVEHRAQLHAYLEGLSRKYDREIRTGAIIYGSREDFEVKVFPVQFDPDFWEDTVLGWASEHTEYRLQEQLPPADPTHDWECKFCDYAERCGKGDLGVSDTGSRGFLPLFTDYPRKSVVEYLDAHRSEGAKLTPSLAQQFPELAREYGAYPWQCSNCGSTFDWDAIEWNQQGEMPPPCPNCSTHTIDGFLRGPAPAEQHDATEGEYVE